MAAGTRKRIDPDLTREQKKKLDEMWEEARKKSQSKNGIQFYVISMENLEMRSQRVEMEEEVDSPVEQKSESTFVQ